MNNPGNGVFPIGIDWIGTTGKLIVLFDDHDDGPGLLNYHTWNGSWTNETDVSMPLKDYTNGILAKRMYSENKVFFVINDNNGNIFSMTYDGTSFNIYNNSETIGTSSGIGTSMPFSMAMRQQQSITLSNHTDGQESDAFGEAQTETDAELFGFTLTPSAGVSPTITEIQFKISQINGLVDGDWTNVEIIIDENNDGKIGAGETTSVGGSGVVNQGAGNITFPTAFTITTANTYILRADFASLTTNDKVTIQLNASGFTTQDGEETEGITSSVTHFENRPAKIAEDDVSLVFGTTNAPADDPRSKIWDDSADDWDVTTQTASTNTAIQHTLNKISPDGQQEIIVTLSKLSASSNLSVLPWTGSTWVQDWNSNSITADNTLKRGFDLEYESMTGNAMIVYSINNSNPIYRVYSSGNWSSPSNVFSTPPGTTAVEWVELVSKPGDDEFTLVYSDTESKLHTVVWRNAAWQEASTENTLTTALKTITEKSFDAAYENLSGDLLIAFAVNGTEGPSFSTRADGSNSWSSTLNYNTYDNDDDIFTVELSLTRLVTKSPPPSILTRMI